MKVFYLQTDSQEFCFKINIKIYIKNASTCFSLITIIRERTIWALLKLLLLKQSESSVKVHRCGQFGGVAEYIIRSCLVYVCDTAYGLGLFRNIWNLPQFQWIYYLYILLWFFPAYCTRYIHTHTHTHTHTHIYIYIYIYIYIPASVV